MVPKNNQGKSSRPPKLTIPLVDADNQLAKRIEIGNEILASIIDNVEQLELVTKNYYRWHAYNKDLLRRIFDTDEISEEYRFWGIAVSGDTFSEKLNILHADIKMYLGRLESIKERLPLFVEMPDMTNRSIPKTKDIFIVHGTNHGLKETLARFLTKLNLKPIVLHEQPNLGTTIIEKLERNSVVSFAIVLLTPDDQGGPRSDGELSPRARQNVVLELGYFIGRLGRERICALYSEGVELPSDYDGVVYTLLDKEGAWQLKLARELKASGFDIDLNSLL